MLFGDVGDGNADADAGAAAMPIALPCAHTTTVTNGIYISECPRGRRRIML